MNNQRLELKFILFFENHSDDFLPLKVKVLVTQSCLTLCDLMNCSPPSFSVHGILQARYWSGLPFPSPGDLPEPRIKPRSPALQADSLLSEPPGESSSLHIEVLTHGVMVFGDGDLGGN